VTWLVDPVVPAALRAVLDDEDLSRGDGFTVQLMTVRGDGWPHLTLLSVGEVVVIDERRLRLALWPDSTSASNLAVRGQLTLSAVIAPTSYLVRASAHRVGEVVGSLAGRLAAFEAVVDEVAADAAPYATLVAGVRYRLTDPPATLPRWAETRRALREAGS
jgi:hypothetical protein